MDKEKIASEFSCTDCAIYNCRSRNREFPSFCLTTEGQSVQADIQETVDYLQKDPIDGTIALAAAQVEGNYYGKLTRVEEIIEFAKRICAGKIGIATCAGLIEEAKVFAAVLKAKGLHPYGVICKVGAVDKCNIGLAEEDKLRPGNYEAMCNPILQARLLNQQKTELNVVIGLCVGHDSLFNKHSEAPVTTLIVKDRLLAHNPVGALYASTSYYKRILQSDR